MDLKRKETIKFYIAILILFIIISVVVSIVIKYQVDGETYMPFELSKIAVISTAEGEQNAENVENVKWNFNINQNNDVYFYITKNEKYKRNAIINSVKIENIVINTNPLKGSVKVYMPSSEEGRRFKYSDSFIVNESLTYTGGMETNEKILTIGNQGGVIPIRFANCDIGKFISNEDDEIVHDGTLLNHINVKNSEIKFSVNFDLIITVDEIKYKTNISLDFPYGDITVDGITKSDIEKENEMWVFKRI